MVPYSENGNGKQRFLSRDFLQILVAGIIGLGTLAGWIYHLHDLDQQRMDSIIIQQGRDEVLLGQLGERVSSDHDNAVIDRSDNKNFQTEMRAKVDHFSDELNALIQAEQLRHGR